ncbi:putative maltose permease (major facilitator superfamily) [Erysiphe necator]|uniref:Putative maltose permease (Major facilitator superfamily) n=1 Tax=Uncinula necator TaxID=52586 RepID=A0A0B1PH49_UNCNE|nr:putative maltose permease (major facilitator superfamily) [Erysiphe necator]
MKSMAESNKAILEDKNPLSQYTSPLKRPTLTEHELSTRAALRNYTPALFWAVMVCMCTVMEGYDTILIPNFFAFPSFAKKYGSFDAATNTYQLSAEWQVALGNSSGISAVLGIFVNGYLVSIYGHKKVLLGSLIFLSAAITVVFLAPNIGILCLGELLCGFPWGIIATIAPAYSSEILPLSLRGYLTTCTDLSFIIGQLLAAGTLDGLLKVDSSWSYRCAFALQWVWPVFIMPILIFMPDSPWHLVRKGKIEEAEKTLVKLTSKNARVDIKETLATIIRTNALEEQTVGGATYSDCFRGTERRRTEIACVTFAGQMLCGLVFAYNATYFFQQIGLNVTKSYQINLGASFISVCGLLFGWFCLLPYIGRRKIYIFGMGSMSTILFLIGFLSFAASIRTVATIQASLCLFWAFVFHLSVGQLGWAIPAEVGSTRLRQKTVCVARIAFYIVNILSKIVEPYFMNPTKLNLKGYTGFFWGIISLLTTLWAFFRLAETKDRTFEELDILFERKVPTRKFASYVIDNPTSSEENSNKV